MSKIMTGMPWVGGMGGAEMGAVVATVANAPAGVVVAAIPAGIVFFGGGGVAIKGAAMAVIPPIAPAGVAPAAPAIVPVFLSESDIELPDFDSDLFGEISDFDC